jgi:alpha/beta superfamily hydrolase
VVGRSQGRWEVGSSELGGASMAVTWPRAFAAAPEPVQALPAPEPR